MLHEPTASEEKKERMEKNARETTTKETGLRLTGSQVSLIAGLRNMADQQTWHAPTQSYILTPKSFGKGIKASQLPSGMVRYFPLPTDHIPSLVTPPSPAPTTSTSSTFGNAQLAPPVPSAPSSAESKPPPLPLTPLTGNNEAKEYAGHALPPKLLLRVLDIVDAELSKLETLLTGLEIRFVGASVLVVYEGDADRLAAALDRLDSRPPKFVSDEPEDDDDLMDLLEDEETDSEGSEESDDLDGPKADEREKRRCPPVVLKLIDFAHTWLEEGGGPDQGVLLGLKTLRGLIAGRRGEVQSAVKEA